VHSFHVGRRDGPTIVHGCSVPACSRAVVKPGHEPPIRYVVGFVGRRDYYQVAVALEGAGRLDRLYTDVYIPDLITPLLNRVGRPGGLALARHAPGLPSGRVQSIGIPKLVGTRRLRRSGVAGTQATRGLSGSIAAHVSRRVLEIGAGTFLYNFDWSAYQAAMDGRRAVRQVLFQAHPPVSACQEILSSERRRSGYVGNPDGDESVSQDDAASYDASLGSADLIVCSSSFVERLLIQRGVERQRVVVVPYGGDFQPRGARRMPHAPAIPDSRTGPLRMLWVGEMAFRKGYHVLFEALRLLPAGAATLTMVCRPVPTNDLLAQLPPNVTVVSSVLDHELEGLFATHDVFVMPSLVEGFGLAYLEAMRAGLPVVGTANSALPDLLEPGSEGFIVAPGDSVGLATCIERYLADPRLARRMGAAAREKASPLTWSAFRTAIVRALDRLDGDGIDS
jgi:glycosyltransferase involved in cell wall biosynthesis